ncbi:MAG: adenylate kinase [Bacilli bacterium]|nr:adenylate kinase [Bacilli bacterium]MDD4076435.1 adenylate kinase [Bacilli bacterium]MDD4387964.1 adenylate kinase [Bacilli bacterium]
MRLLIMGPPGVGKGTMAKHINNVYHIPHISTGELYREAITKMTPIGKLAKDFLDRGELVPDDITVNLVKRTLKNENYQKGFLLDGFPRTIPQAQALDDILKQNNWKIDMVLNLLADDELLIERISGRRTCKKCGELYHIINKKPKIRNICDQCGGILFQRPDDNRETVAHRLKVYQEQTQSLLEYYHQRHLLRNINGAGTIEENIAEVEKILGGFNDND